jgi:hypothetical protein
MIKAFIIFLVLFVVFYGGIHLFRSLTGKEKLEYAKLLTYSLGCATLAVSVLFLIVFLF